MKFEYRLETLRPDRGDVQVNLDVLGRQGWELVSVVSSDGGWCRFYFKRNLDRVAVPADTAA